MLIEPWFIEAYEFQLTTELSYSRYTAVNHALTPLKTPSNNYLFAVDLGGSLTESFSADVEVNFAKTPEHSLNFQSGAVQGRFLWLNDLVGDPISVTTGLNMRGVLHTWLHDISSPYHGVFNTELNLALGKEWSQGPFWRFHLFGFGALGFANVGAPWTRCTASFQTNWVDKHQLEVFTEGYFGFGAQPEIDIEHFQGYGSIHHQSMDIGASYSYLLDFWGKFSFEYAYRFFARSYPERTSTLMLRYELPFSPF